LAIGGVLLVVGFVLLAMSYPTVQNLQTSLGQLGQLLNPSLNQEYRQALMTTYIGGFLGVLGFIFLIVGAAVSGSPPIQTQAIPPEKELSQEESEEQRVQRRFQAARNVSLSEKCPACRQTMIDQGHQYYCIRDNILIHKASGIRLSDLPLEDRAYFDQSAWIPNIGDSLMTLTADALIISDDEGKVRTTLPLARISELTVKGQSLRVKTPDEVYLLERVGQGLGTKGEDWVKEIRLTQKFKPILPVATPVTLLTKHSTAEDQPRLQTKFCRECGSKIPRDSKFCEECGTKLV
jgi:ribosomal protein L40E